jgi:hypothetical protein
LQLLVPAVSIEFQECFSLGTNDHGGEAEALQFMHIRALICFEKLRL